MPRLASLLAALALGFASPAAFAAGVVTVVDDSFFDVADWEVVEIPQEPSECIVLRDPSGPTFCDSQNDASSDGDGRSHGGTTQISGEPSVTTSMVVGSHVKEHLAYDPAASGAVTSLDASYQFLVQQATQNVTSTLRGHLLVKQDGRFYISVASLALTSMEGVTPAFFAFVLDDVTADDFVEVLIGGLDPASHPDFSADGEPLQFGYAVDMAWDGPLPSNPFVLDFLVRSYRIDEFQVAVRTAAPVPVAGWGLRALLVGLLASSAFARLARRRRDGLQGRVLQQRGRDTLEP